jgi:hypothetical protein
VVAKELRMKNATYIVLMETHLDKFFIDGLDEKIPLLITAVFVIFELGHELQIVIIKGTHLFVSLLILSFSFECDGFFGIGI